MFHFHPRSTNPELWRTTVPLVVRERCGRHKGLIATWTAIHWLIVLHAASGRAHFGVREIAEEAGVGRNELAGEAGYIQRLVSLGLIRIVGYRAFRGFREPRPVYHIDLAELERLSLELVPQVLRDRHVDRPPPAAPDQRQLRLFNLPAGEEAGAPGEVCHPHRSGTEGMAPDMGRMSHGTAPPGNGTVSPVVVRGGHAFVQPAPDSETALARNRDVERTSERMNEGAGQALSPDLIQSIVTQVTRAVLASLQPPAPRAGPQDEGPLAVAPAAPAGAEPLPFSVLALWQGDEPSVSRRELHQLTMLAAEYDGPTGGHGAYWLGRAIAMADLCLGERGQPRSLAYLRRVLRRWRDEGSWGSDREPGEAAPRPPAEPQPRPQAAAGGPPDAAYSHPAVRAYVEALRETPNAIQAAQIAETVADLAVWRQVLTDWQLNGWGERSVGKMLDRYRKTAPGAAPPEAPPSVAVIHTYPGLSMEQRERWIRAFHAAASPTEKRAVLARLAQEHPQ